MDGNKVVRCLCIGTPMLDVNTSYSSRARGQRQQQLQHVLVPYLDQHAGNEVCGACRPNIKKWLGKPAMINGV